MIDILLKEGTWFLFALIVSLFSAFVLIAVEYRRRVARTALAIGACNLFFGILIGIAGIGHLFGVTTKAVLGILAPNISLWFAIPFGFALAGPAWWLTFQTRGLVTEHPVSARTATWLNVWLALVLASQGPAIVLAAPAGLNLLLLHLSARRRRGARPA